jgi:hypothetical protein
MFSFFILLVLVTSNGPSQATTGDVSGVPNSETSFYHGTINQTLEVELTLTRKGNTITGTYEYAAHQQPIHLQGTLLADGLMKISESAGGGASGGQFLLDNLLGYGHLDGKWNSADGKRSYPVHLGKLDEAQHRQLRQMWGDKQPIQSIAIGELYGCALRQSGALCWGNVLSMPSLATAGPGMIARRALPNLLIPAGTSSLSIAGSQSCLLHDGAMKCWQRSSNMDWFRFKPTVVKGFESDVSAIGAGDGFVCGIARNRLTCWDGTSMNPNNFVTLANDVVGVSSGSPRCALVHEGFRCWTIKLSYSPPAFGFTEKQNVPDRVEHLAATADDGYGNSLVCWTQAGDLKCAADKFRTQADKRVVSENQFTAGVTDVAVTGDHSCIIWRDDVYCWGANDHGQLGDGTRQLASATRDPVKVVLPGTPRQVAVADGVSCALTATSGVYCWGNNGFAQTGATSRDSCDMPNGHSDKTSDPCNLKPVRVLGLP